MFIIKQKKMNTMHFILNIKPLSLNKMLRMHWAKRSKEQILYDYAILEAKQKLPFEVKKLLPLNNIINACIIYHFADNRIRDYDNYSGKFIFDALKHNGIIVDDNCKIIKKIELQIKLNCNQEYTEIILTY